VVPEGCALDGTFGVTRITRELANQVDLVIPSEVNRYVPGVAMKHLVMSICAMGNSAWVTPG
jgi:hypothetical protein